MMAIGAATTIAQQQAQEEAAANAARTQQEALVLNNQLTHMDLTRKAQQESEVAASESNAYAMAARKDMATLDAFNGEWGGGNTGSRAVAVMGIQQGQDLATISGNAMKKQQEISLASSAANVSRDQGIASITKPVRSNTLLTIAGQTAGQYAGYKARQPMPSK